MDALPLTLSCVTDSLNVNFSEYPLLLTTSDFVEDEGKYSFFHRPFLNKENDNNNFSLNLHIKVIFRCIFFFKNNTKLIKRIFSFSPIHSFFHFEYLRITSIFLAMLTIYFNFLHQQSSSCSDFAWKLHKRHRFGSQHNSWCVWKRVIIWLSVWCRVCLNEWISVWFIGLLLSCIFKCLFAHSSTRCSSTKSIRPFYMIYPFIIFNQSINQSINHSFIHSFIHPSIPQLLRRPWVVSCPLSHRSGRDSTATLRGKKRKGRCVSFLSFLSSFPSLSLFSPWFFSF